MGKPDAKNRAIEKLHHFRCLECDKWWTIGDAPADKYEWFCPWCGERNKYEKRDKK